MSTAEKNFHESPHRKVALKDVRNIGTAAERRCDIRGTMRMTDGSEIVFEVFTDDTMESGGAVLEGAKMRQFIYSFVAGFAASAPVTTEAAQGAEG